jgi:uncharacterized membrane protein
MTEEWYNSENPTKVARGAAWRFGVFILIFMAIFATLSLLFWGFRVVTSDIKGQGNAVIIKNDAVNRIAQQERFEQLYADIKAADLKVGVAYDALQVNPVDKTLQTNYTGTINYCISVVADYDALARKYSAEDFRSADLPEQIVRSDSSTDCKE